MKRLASLIFMIASLAIYSAAQSKPNESISKQIKALRAEKTFTLSYDPNSNVTKLMAVTDNFDDPGKIGVQAMNFAIGFMYSGKELTKAPDSIQLSFWVLTKKPRFAANHNLLVTQANLDLGAARYISRSRDNMEYLNFDISRENLARIAGEPNARIRLGEAVLTFTRSQLKAISDILILSDPER